jgi:hypothetical protein
MPNHAGRRSAHSSCRHLLSEAAPLAREKTHRGETTSLQDCPHPDTTHAPLAKGFSNPFLCQELVFCFCEPSRFEFRPWGFSVGDQRNGLIWARTLGLRACGRVLAVREHAQEPFQWRRVLVVGSRIHSKPSLPLPKGSGAGLRWATGYQPLLALLLITVSACRQRSIAERRRAERAGIPHPRFDLPSPPHSP